MTSRQEHGLFNCLKGELADTALKCMHGRFLWCINFLNHFERKFDFIARPFQRRRMQIHDELYGKYSHTNPSFLPQSRLTAKRTCITESSFGPYSVTNLEHGTDSFSC